MLLQVCPALPEGLGVGVDLHDVSDGDARVGDEAVADPEDDLAPGLQLPLIQEVVGTDNAPLEAVLNRD